MTTQAPTPPQQEDDSAPSSWWVIDESRLRVIAGMCGWVLLACALIAAGMERTLLTVLSLVVLSAVGLEMSPWANRYTRMTVFIGAQAALLMLVATRL